MGYNPTDWYWIVGDVPSGQVFSSAGMQYVADTDVSYQAWLVQNKAATKILNAMELAEVLSDQWIPRYLSQGVTVTSTGTPALTDMYGADPVSLGNITSLSTGIAAGKPLPGGGSTFAYPAGTAHVFTAPAFLEFAAAMEGLVYGVSQAVAQAVAGQTVTVPALSLQIS